MNGYEGDPFPIRSGVAQGCAASPILYIIFTEALTRLVNHDQSWTGIPFSIPGSIRRHHHEGISIKKPDNPRRIHITEVIIKILQYADDTIICIAFPHLNLPSAFATINIYLEATGGKLNGTKCEGFLSGQAREDIPQASFEWLEDGKYLISLGLPHGNDFDEDEFWEEIIQKMRLRASTWHTLFANPTEARAVAVNPSDARSHMAASCYRSAFPGLCWVLAGLPEPSQGSPGWPGGPRGRASHLSHQTARLTRTAALGRQLPRHGMRLAEQPSQQPRLRKPLRPQRRFDRSIGPSESQRAVPKSVRVVRPLPLA
jgi:hypothetical protein